MDEHRKRGRGDNSGDDASAIALTETHADCVCNTPDGKHPSTRELEITIKRENVLLTGAKRSRR